MIATAITTTCIPHGASVLERASIHLASTIARRAVARAQRREDRRAALLAAIHREQTRTADPHATDHALARMGLPRK